MEEKIKVKGNNNDTNECELKWPFFLFVRSFFLSFVCLFVCSFDSIGVGVFGAIIIHTVRAYLSHTHFHFAFSFGVMFASFAFVTLTVFTLLNGFDIYLCILMCSSICHL